jgi:hypothetical protein
MSRNLKTYLTVVTNAYAQTTSKLHVRLYKAQNTTFLKVMATNDTHALMKESNLLTNE